MKKIYIFVIALISLLFLTPKLSYATSQGWRGLCGNFNDTTTDGKSWIATLGYKTVYNDPATSGDGSRCRDTTSGASNPAYTSGTSANLKFSAFWCKNSNSGECGTSTADYKNLSTAQNFSITVPTYGSNTTHDSTFSITDTTYPCGRVQADIGPDPDTTDPATGSNAIITGHVHETNSNCTDALPPAFDFTIANGGDKSVQQGSSVTNSISITRSAGITASVSLSASSLSGSGVTFSFSSTSCTPSDTCSSTLTMNANSTATTGSRTIRVTGTSGSGASTRTYYTEFTLNVTAPSPTPTPTPVPGTPSCTTSVPSATITTISATGNIAISNITASTISLTTWKLDGFPLETPSPANTLSRVIGSTTYPLTSGSHTLETFVTHSTGGTSITTTCTPAITFTIGTPTHIHHYKCNADNTCEHDENGAYTSSNCNSSCKPTQSGPFYWEESPDISCQGQANGTATADIKIDWKYEGSPTTNDPYYYEIGRWKYYPGISSTYECIRCGDGVIGADDANTFYTDYAQDIYSSGVNPWRYSYQINGLDRNKDQIYNSGVALSIRTPAWINLTSYCLPDLIVDPATADPNSITLGESVTITAKVKNTGWGATAPSSDAGAFCRQENNSKVCSYPKHTGIIPLNQLSPDDITWSYIPTDTGSFYSIEVCADYGNGVNETNEANNCKMTNTFTVTPRPVDLNPGNITISPTTISPGMNVTFKVDVSNTGTGDAGSFNNRFCVNTFSYDTSCSSTTSTRIGTSDQTIASLSGNGGTYLNFTSPSWTSSIPGNYYVHFCADVGNAIIETSETNNCSSKTFSVIAPYYPWIQVDGDVHSNTKIDLSGGPP